MKWGADVQQFLETAEATDANTVVFTFKVPAPRFFDFVAYKFDIGVYIVPKHIFEGQDWATFTHFDIAKGWPVTTGPWRVVFSAPEQKVLDRADDWWGVDGRRRPSCRRRERFIYLPDPGEQGLVAGIIANQYDIDTGIQPASFADRLRRQRQGHHLDRAGGAVRLHRLVAALPLPQQRGARRTTTRTSAGRSATTSTASRSSRSPGWAPVSPRPCSCPTTRRCSRSSRRSQPLIERVPLPGVQPGEGRRAAHRQGLDQGRRRHVAGRDRRSRSSSRSSASSTSPASARSSSSS